LFPTGNNPHGVHPVKVGRWRKIRPGKTTGSSGVTVQIPVLPELQASIDAAETGDLAFLVADWGRPFSFDGLGTKCASGATKLD